MHSLKAIDKGFMRHKLARILHCEVCVTSDLAYIRWHGTGDGTWFNYKYSEEQLTEWVPKVQEASGKAGKVLGYFNNHFHGYAPENALQIMEMLGVVTPHGSAALRRVRLRGREREIAAEPKGLEAWTGPVIEKGLENLLLSFSRRRNTEVKSCGGTWTSPGMGPPSRDWGLVPLQSLDEASPRRQRVRRRRRTVA